MLTTKLGTVLEVVSTEDAVDTFRCAFIEMQFRTLEVLFVQGLSCLLSIEWIVSVLSLKFKMTF